MGDYDSPTCLLIKWVKPKEDRKSVGFAESLTWPMYT